MIAKRIFNLATEALSKFNDGWSKKNIIKKLTEHTRTAETEELIFIYKILAQYDSALVL